MLQITLSSQNYDITHFRQIVVKMSWLCDETKKFSITISSHFYHNLTKKFYDLHLLWRTPTRPFCLINGHKVTKMWWKCDDLKLVLIFWSTSFENSRHYKTWCQMPDASMSMPVWALPFVPSSLNDIDSSTSSKDVS